ncbi:amidohydrolase family protein [Acidisphaera sp. L21]|uniref:amidohydrolase family protein n=1 Tax=Acidisphaera sp. L21 TaxID=1641851 RepID=UPI001C20872F|nr:amidohydrolase family protein [Acidisphaera sp. L21]
MTLPPGACDSHVHTYGPFDRFPVPDDRSFTPNEAPETALRHLHDHLGFDRAVIVQSQGHGFDHRPMLEALAIGAGRYRGVALIRPQDTDVDIAAMNAAGVCGARFSFMSHLGANPPAAAIHAVADRVRQFDWHISIHVAGSGLVEHEAMIRSIQAPVVIDHMGRLDLDEGLDGPAVTTLLRLLDTGSIWVKLSGTDRVSKTGAPYRDVAPLARRLATHAPQRVIWGSDWPHVNLHAPMPDDGDLVDLIAEIAPTIETKQALLVDNPTRLFGFTNVL